MVVRLFSTPICFLGRWFSRSFRSGRRLRRRLLFRLKDRPLRPAQPFTIVRRAEPVRPRPGVPGSTDRLPRYYLWPEDLKLYFLLAGLFSAIPFFLAEDRALAAFAILIAVFGVPFLLFSPRRPWLRPLPNQVLACVAEGAAHASGVALEQLFRIRASRSLRRFAWVHGGYALLARYLPRLLKPQDTRAVDPLQSARAHLVVIGIVEFFNPESNEPGLCQKSISRWYIYWMSPFWTGYALLLGAYVWLPDNQEHWALKTAVFWTMVSAFFVHRQSCTWLHLGQLVSTRAWQEKLDLLLHARIEFSQCEGPMHFPQLRPFVVQRVNLLPAAVLAILSLVSDVDPDAAAKSNEQSPCVSPLASSYTNGIGILADHSSPSAVP